MAALNNFVGLFGIGSTSLYSTEFLTTNWRSVGRFRGFRIIPRLYGIIYGRN